MRSRESSDGFAQQTCSLNEYPQNFDANRAFWVPWKSSSTASCMSLKAKQIFGLGGKTPGEARVVQWHFTIFVKHDYISDENCITVSMP